MPKPKLCSATTQKGQRCRNRGNPNASGLCARHAKSQLQRGPVAAAPNESRSGSAIAATISVEIIGGLIPDICEAIIQVIAVVEFVSRKWPQVPHLARHRVLNPKPNAAANLIKDCERMIKSGHQDANLASRFERWFESLPSTVKLESDTEFGDIRSIIRVLRDSSA